MAYQRVRDILLRITGDPSDAERALHDLTREVKEFGTLQAEATVGVNTAPAEKAVAKAKDQVREFGRLTESARLDLKTAGAEAQIERLRQRLENLQKREASPKIDIQIAKVLGQIEVVEGRLRALDGQRAELKIDVDRSLLARTTAAMSGALAGAGEAAKAGGRSLGVFISAATTGIPIIGSLGSAFLAVGASGGAAAGAMLALVPIIAALAVAIAGALAVALAALAASFAAAAAGAVALGVALAAALGPVVLVVIAAMARLAQIIKAVKEAEEQGAAQARRVRDARQAVAEATENQADAAQRLEDTTVSAYRAWADAAEDVEDAVRGIAEAELSRDQARLNVKKAEQDLRDFRKETGLAGDEFDNLFKKFTDVNFRPENLIAAIGGSAAGGKVSGDTELDLAQKILNVRSARQAEEAATDGVADAKTRAARAQENLNAFEEKGLAAFAPYAQAMAAQTEATENLRDATEKLNDARAEQGKQLAQLDPRERRLARVLGDLKKSLTEAVRPATDAIFGGVLDFLEELDKFAGRSQVRRGLRDIGEAIAYVFRSWGRELGRREVREGFLELSRGAARLLRAVGGEGFRQFFRLLLRIAREALPLLEDRVQGVVRFIRRLADGASDSKRLERIINDLVDHFDKWVGLARAVGRLVLAFFRDAKGPGKSLVEDITRLVNKWAAFIEKNPQKVKDFINDAIDLAKDFVRVLGAVLRVLEKIIDAVGKAIGLIQKAAEFAGKLQALRPGSDEQHAASTTADTIRRFKSIAADPSAPASSRAYARSQLRELGVPGYRLGGLIRGLGVGDRIPIMAEPGEFMLRRSIVDAIGVGKLQRLNQGQLGALAPAGGRGMTIQEQNVYLPPAPGHDQLGDPRHQAVQFARELKRRGGGRL